MKKSSRSLLDNFVYILACICTAGGAWALRIIITRAIKKAFKDDNQQL